jgi:hypothetical protein
VRIWKRKLRDGTFGLRGKVQHVVSGASCYFDGLANLPEALGKMMDQETGSFDTGTSSPPGDRHKRSEAEQVDAC